MAVPDYQTIMRPLMDYASDRAEHTSREAVEVLATKFVLSIEDRRELRHFQDLNQSIFMVN